MEITFKEITKDNLYPLSLLKLGEGQDKFVAPNMYSVAQSKFHPAWLPLGIYLGEELIGFFMYGVDDEDNTMWIIRMMIDVKFQGKGYGRESLGKLIEHIKANENCSDIFLSFVPGNDRAKNLYEQYGFTDTGRVESGEIVYKLTL